MLLTQHLHIVLLYSAVELMILKYIVEQELWEEPKNLRLRGYKFPLSKITPVDANPVW